MSLCNIFTKFFFIYTLTFMDTTCKDTNYRVWEVSELRILGSPLYRDNKICSQQGVSRDDLVSIHALE